MQRLHAEQFYQSGKIRIGSLYDFRNIEKYGEETGDDGEGTKELYTTQKHVHEGNIPRFLQDAIKVGPGSHFEWIIDGDHKVSRKFSDPNCYVYCVSMDFSEDRMRRMQHDACVVIEHESYFHHIHNAIKPKLVSGSKGVLCSVHYGPRYLHHSDDHDIPLAAIKPERFRYQQEARAIWLPCNEKEVEEYFYVSVPMAIRACRPEPILIDL